MQQHFFSHRFFVILLLGIAGITLPLGCQDNKTGSSKTAAKNSQADAQNKSSVQRGSWTNANGQKMWGKHPYDVWHSNPDSIAKNKTKIGTEAGTGTAHSQPTKPPPLLPTDGTIVWKTLVPILALDAEAKRIRQQLAQKTQTIARYNSGYKEIQYQAATLAAIAIIVSQHTDSLFWKNDALYIRDIGTQIQSSAIAPGREKYNATKIACEQFADFMDRNRPAELPALKKDDSFDFHASRGGLMQRLNVSHQWLKTEVPDAATLKAESQTVIQQATVLLILSQVILDASYDSADEKEYQTFAKNMVIAAQEMIAATQRQQFANYQTAVGKIVNNCNRCHSGYKD